jgi:membrane protease YdiL (CAAX protease family)
VEDSQLQRQDQTVPESNSEQAPASVPWSVRDVVFGLGFLVVWWLVFGFSVGILQLAQINIDPGVLVGLAEMLLLLPVWWFAIRKYHVGWDTVGLRDFRTQALGVGCGLMIASSLFNVVYSAIISQFGLESNQNLAPLLAGLDTPVWLLISGVVVAPVVEEIFFRGFVYAGLRQRFDWKTAAVLSAFLFALVHLQPAMIPPIFILGLIFAYLYHRSQSIWPAIIMHVSTNALALGAAYLMSQL